MRILHYRKSTRLKGFDYSAPGLYFITICTKRKEKMFGDVIDGQMEMNAGGKVVLDCWNAIPLHYPNVKLHRFVVMPNHVHGIIEITSFPHAENLIVGVQNFEPLQYDQSQGESTDLPGIECDDRVF